MWTPIIGENAGKIWQVLNEKGQTDIGKLRNVTGLNNQELYLALGWLCRESKIGIEQKQNIVLINLA
jgi:hypothetical protein